MKEPLSKDHLNDQIWLFGVPQNRATLWLRIYFWRNTMGRHNVSELMQLRTIYCSLCGKGQSFADQCCFCKCDFSYFVVIKANPATLLKQKSYGIRSHDSAQQSWYNELFVNFHTFYIRLRDVSVRNRMIAAILMSMFLISLGVGIARYRSNSHNHYTHNYVLALYGINSGMTLIDKVRNGTYKDWKDGNALDGTRLVGIDSQTIADLTAVKIEIDNIIKKIESHPTEYNQAAQTLQNLYATYNKTNSLILNSPDSLTLHGMEIVNFQKDFFQELERLKANMPLSLMDEFKKNSHKYDLSFMAAKK